MIGRICGTGSYIPSHRMDNVELSSLVDTSDEWIRERTGIQSRHLAKEETVSFMAAKAAEEALADSGLEAEEIDLILVATSSSETVFPNTSCEVQKAIGAVHAWGYDLNAACSGFILALNTAQSYIRSGLVKTALAIGAEKMSRIVDWKDRELAFYSETVQVQWFSGEKKVKCRSSLHGHGTFGRRQGRGIDLTIWNRRNAGNSDGWTGSF